MIFADAEFYKNEYLLGRSEVIPLSEFAFWADKATERINLKKVELDEIPTYLAKCTCEVAELYYVEYENNQSDNIKSESVGGYSVSYTDQRQGENLESNIQKVILRWLANTELHNQFIYRGV